MDRNTITGFFLIFVLVTAWAYFTSPSAEELEQQRRTQFVQDSLRASQRLNNVPQITGKDPLQATADVNTVAGAFKQDSVLEARTFDVDAGSFILRFNTRGGGPSQIIFKEYNRWDGSPIELFADTLASAYSMGFISQENYNIETRGLIFESPQQAPLYTLSEGEQREFIFTLPTDNGQKLEYRWLVTQGSYEVKLQANFVGLNSGYIAGNQVDLSFRSRLQFTEKDRTQEGMVVGAYLYAGGELETFHMTESGREQSNATGQVDWVASRTKFFAQIIKPEQPSEAAQLTGALTGDHDEANTIHHYTTSLSSNIPVDGSLSYRLFVGPMRYNLMKEYDEHAFDMVDVGYSWTRWFSDPLVRFVILPFFSIVAGWVGNYGIAIILFAVAVKLILSPLTVMSYRSMAAMREVQPKMQAIQEKYKENPQKQQEEVMKLYRKEKVNPLGGCLPMLLQFPILITLWRFFQNTIQVRQESFLWAADLSAPDYVIDLPFEIPLVGAGIGGFVTLMSAAMVVQSRVSGGGATGGGVMAQQMKIMQYFFPIMLFVFFNKFASGLSLYYLVFNVLSIAQQMYINKQTHAKKEAEEALVIGKKGKKK